MIITEQIHQAVLKVPAPAWTPAIEPDGEIRDGAWVAELTGDCLKSWPKAMRLIVRKERPHPGAQLRITDADGLRLTAFATNTADGPIAVLELRHRQRSRAGDRIRAVRDTGLRTLPLHDIARNQIWPCRDTGQGPPSEGRPWTGTSCRASSSRFRDRRRRGPTPTAWNASRWSRPVACSTRRSLVFSLAMMRREHTWKQICFLAAERVDGTMAPAGATRPDAATFA